jgi:hypothetical protein
LSSLRYTAEAKAAEEGNAIEKPIFAIDGKTSRRSHDHAKGLGALHTVSVWASDFGLSLGQVACAVRSNEITAIPELLRLVDIQGTIITIDAMGAQKAIAEQIVGGEADYVLALKGNQETLHQAVNAGAKDPGRARPLEGALRGADAAAVPARLIETRCWGRGLPPPASRPKSALLNPLQEIDGCGPPSARSTNCAR